MKEYKAENVRNIGIIGHGGTGKTSLAEAILFYTKESDRLGRTDDGTSILDYDPEEKKRKISISSAVANCVWNGHKIYLVDTPGYFDFVGEVIQGLKGVDAALISVCGVSGLQVGTEKSWDYVNRYKIPRAFFINKLDRENSSYDKALQSLKDRFGLAVVPIEIPIGKESEFKGVVNIINKKAKVYDSKLKSMVDVEVASELMPTIDEYRSALMEAVAETDEELLDKYLSDGELSEEEIIRGLKKGILSCEIAPVFCGSALSNIGIHTLLDNIVLAISHHLLREPLKVLILKTR
ncbi:MAG: hypothetical protein KatS3mg079_319 [Caloramator sp.]|nr:MAG: hypothetical protein KatS3mg079_319 [Caloramator sp.]